MIFKVRGGVRQFCRGMFFLLYIVVCLWWGEGLFLHIVVAEKRSVVGSFFLYIVAD